MLLTDNIYVECYNGDQKSPPQGTNLRHRYQVAVAIFSITSSAAVVIDAADDDDDDETLITSINSAISQLEKPKSLFFL